MIVGAIDSSGVTNLAAPRRMASRGMPKTTHVASFCAIVRAPASRISKRPAGAVVPHAGHDHAGRVRAGRLGRRAKQHLDAGAVATDRRAFDQLDPIACARSANEAVDVTRDHEGPARPDRLVLPRLGDFDLDPRVIVAAAWQTRS